MSVDLTQVRDELSDEDLSLIFYETYHRHKNNVGSVNTGAMTVARREIYDAITKDDKAELEALRAQNEKLQGIVDGVIEACDVVGSPDVMSFANHIDKICGSNHSAYFDFEGDNDGNT